MQYIEITFLFMSTVFLFYLGFKYDSNNRVLQKQRLSVQDIPSFEDILDYVDIVFAEIFKMKYEFHYQLKDAKMIKDMDKDIKSIANDVITSFSDNFMDCVEFYVTREYFYALITRKSRMYIIQYLEKNRVGAGSE